MSDITMTPEEAFVNHINANTGKPYRYLRQYSVFDRGGLSAQNINGGKPSAKI